MALETHQYTSIPRNVLAVRVNSQNMREVAAWCNGEINNKKPDGSRGPRHIRLDLPSAKDERQKKAYPGDWVVHNEKGFRIFIDKSFQMNFVQIDGVDSVFHETGIPAKKSAKKKRPNQSAKKKGQPQSRPINPVMAAAMKAAQEKLGATEIVQADDTVVPTFSDVETKDTEVPDMKVIKGATLHSVSVVSDPPHPDWKIESVKEVRTVENSLDRITGLPATVYTPPEDLVSPDAEINPEGALMEKANERQDPADAKKVDAAVETAPQDPPAEPAPSNPTIDAPVATETDDAIVVEPENPTAG